MDVNEIKAIQDEEGVGPLMEKMLKMNSIFSLTRFFAGTIADHNLNRGAWLDDLPTLFAAHVAVLSKSNSPKMRRIALNLSSLSVPGDEVCEAVLGFFYGGHML